MTLRTTTTMGAALCLLVCLVACTTSPPAGDPATTSSASSTRSTATPEPSDPEPATQQPLVIVGHATLPRPRLSVRAARRVVQDLGRADRPQAAVRAVGRKPGLRAVVPASVVGPTVRTAIVGGVDPVLDPTAYPIQVDGSAPPDEPVTLTVTGDIMLDRGVTDPAAALAPLRDRLRGADLTVGNLESTLSTAGEPQQGSDSFAAVPSVVPLLRGAGFDALSLANNHTGDYGERALLQTVGRLDRSTVTRFGAGRNLADAARPAVLRSRGVRFGFLGFNAIGETPQATASTPGALTVRMPPRTGPLNRTDLAYLVRRVRLLDRRVDVVVVLPHWGTQYTHRPEPVQRLVSRRLVDAGADLVVGGHPHWVQGLDAYAGAVVAHSLGNFVFDMDFETQTQQGVLLEATYWGSTLKALDLVPYRMDAGFAPRLVAGPESRDTLGDVWAASTGPFRVPPD